MAGGKARRSNLCLRRVELTLCQIERRVDQGVQGARRPLAERRREARDQAGEHAELLSLGVALQGLHPQEEEADALATDLRVDLGALDLEMIRPMIHS